MLCSHSQKYIKIYAFSYYIDIRYCSWNRFFIRLNFLLLPTSYKLNTKWVISAAFADPITTNSPNPSIVLLMALEILTFPLPVKTTTQRSRLPKLSTPMEPLIFLMGLAMRGSYKMEFLMAKEKNTTRLAKNISDRSMKELSMGMENIISQTGACTRDNSIVVRLKERGQCGGLTAITMRVYSSVTLSASMGNTIAREKIAITRVNTWKG